MREVSLTKGCVALVDDSDFDRVSQHRWYASLDSRGTKYYAKRRRKKEEAVRFKSQKIRMHHFVLDIAPSELPEGHIVHHKNDDGLDNRRENLEIITQEENMQRSSGWKKKLDSLAEIDF